VKLAPGESFNEQVAKFKACLQKFNRVHSLTNYDDLDAVVRDSLSGANFIPRYPRIGCDIGSGAGFPGLFLALALPLCEWHLFEPNLKKAAFLTYAKVSLALTNVKIHAERVQDGAKLRADLISSRALMSARSLIEICRGFYDQNTTFLLYKGSGAEAEAEEFHKEFTGARCEIFSDENALKNRKFLVIKGVK
jgi:16S rRNA methyltransferase gidB